jgi:hypothetical protein
MFVLIALDKDLEQFFTILFVLAMFLSISEARTFITNGVLESCWYEKEYKSKRSFLGEIVREEEAMKKMEKCFFSFFFFLFWQKLFSSTK